MSFLARALGEPQHPTIAQRTRALNIIFVLGAPASGKGTLCHILSEQHNIFHLSVGDHLREIAQNPTSDQIPTATSIKHYLDNNDLVPPATIVDILSVKLNEECQKGAKTFLIDEFPRDEASAILFEKNISFPSKVLLVTCPRNIALARFLLRKRGGEKDTTQVFSKRYAEFESNNAILVDQHSAAGILGEVDSSGPTEETLEEVLEVMGFEAVELEGE